MRRRRLLTSLGAALTLGSLGPPRLAHASAGGMRLLDTSESGLRVYLAELRARLRRIERSRLKPELRRYFRQRGFPARMPKDIARMRLVTSAFHELPEALQEHPRVQLRMAYEAPRIARTVMRLTDLLKGHSEEELDAMKVRLNEHPQLGEDLAVDLMQMASLPDLPAKAMEQDRQALNSAVTELTHGSPSRVVAECIEAVEKECAAAGFQQDQWREHIDPADDEPEVLDDEWRVERPDGEAAITGFELSEDEKAALLVIRAAFLTLGLALSTVAGGIGLSVVVSALTGDIFFLIVWGGLAIIVGAVLAFLGLALLLVGILSLGVASVKGRTGREQRREELLGDDELFDELPEAGVEEDEGTAEEAEEAEDEGAPTGPPWAD